MTTAPTALPSPLPWVWDSDLRELRDADGESVINAFVEFSLEPGEGIDEQGLEVSPEDAALIVRAVNERARLIEALEECADYLEHATEYRLGNPGFEMAAAVARNALARAKEPQA